MKKKFFFFLPLWWNVESGVFGAVGEERERYSVFITDVIGSQLYRVIFIFYPPQETNQFLPESRRFHRPGVPNKSEIPLLPEFSEFPETLRTFSWKTGLYRGHAQSTGSCFIVPGLIPRDTKRTSESKVTRLNAQGFKIDSANFLGS